MDITDLPDTKSAPTANLLDNSDIILVSSPERNDNSTENAAANNSIEIVNDSKELNDSFEAINHKANTSRINVGQVNATEQQQQQSSATNSVENNAQLLKNKISPITANSEQTSGCPIITIHAGPPPKRNFAVKRTSQGAAVSASSLPSIDTASSSAASSITVSRSSSRIPLNRRISNYVQDDSDMDEDEELRPSKSYRLTHPNDSDSSDSGMSGGGCAVSSSKRKSARQIKKPRILDEFVTGEQIQPSSGSRTSVHSNSSTSIINNSSPPAKAAFARKSTARYIPPSAASRFSLSQPKQQLRPQPLRMPSITSTVPSAKISAATKASATAPVTSAATFSLQNLNNMTKPFSSSALTKTSMNGNSAKRNGSNTNVIPASTASNNAATVGQMKQTRNKMITCKPLLHSKATECTPIVKDASTQVDLDEIKLSHTIVPLPVPINVPLPMCMYQAPMPVPLFIPIPIPVPVFLPTTKKTFDRIKRKIKKLREKLPSDPYEFELLMYAEKLARNEGLPGFEDSSDGESSGPDEQEPEQQQHHYHQSSDILNHHEQLYHQSGCNEPSGILSTCGGSGGFFKWNIGVKGFHAWLSGKLNKLEQQQSMWSSSAARTPNNLLKLKNGELDRLLAEFVNEVRKPTGEVYAPESIYYICLGVQFYLQEKASRQENVFLDGSGVFDEFQEAFNRIALRYNIRIDADGQIVSKIEEEILWEAKQLGVHSPSVLLHTVLYFNTKYFFLDKVEAHKKLSFTNVKRHSKRNIGPNGEDYGRSTFLRYYPDFHGLEQVIYEQGENYDNPLRCPVELYNFYLSKCPESVKNRSDLFYLMPEKASLPSSPVWFSSQPVSDRMLERMLNRIKMVKEVNELLLAASPASASVIIQ